LFQIFFEREKAAGGEERKKEGHGFNLSSPSSGGGGGGGGIFSSSSAGPQEKKKKKEDETPACAASYLSHFVVLGKEREGPRGDDSLRRASPPQKRGGRRKLRSVQFLPFLSRKEMKEGRKLLGVLPLLRPLQGEEKERRSTTTEVIKIYISRGRGGGRTKGESVQSSREEKGGRGEAFPNACATLLLWTKGEKKRKITDMIYLLAAEIRSREERKKKKMTPLLSINAGKGGPQRHAVFCRPTEKKRRKNILGPACWTTINLIVQRGGRTDCWRRKGERPWFAAKERGGRTAARRSFFVAGKKRGGRESGTCFQKKAALNYRLVRSTVRTKGGGRSG